MTILTRGRYRARFAETPTDVEAAQRLRHQAFRGGAGVDRDLYDALCRHVLVEDTRDAALVCCFRLLPLDDGRAITRCYSAQFYALDALEAFEARMVEMGRFCIAPGRSDPDILRIAWAALTAYVDAEGIEMLFGCSSFQGTEGEAYQDAFALLSERHLAPKRWLPRVKAPQVFRFRGRTTGDRRRGMRLMPPLLKTYLMMGGWVSDHAVVDPDLGTLHVFTGLEIGRIPAARKRLLRAVAG